MKTKILFVCLVFCFVYQANAQTSKNTIVNENASWSTLSYVWGADNNGNSAIVHASTAYHFFDGDTVVGDKTYKKLYEYTDEQHINATLRGFMREENKKTYFVDNRFTPNFLLENILYDFSLEQGDVFEKVWQAADFHGNIYRDTMYFQVKSCDDTIINGALKKRMVLTIHEDYDWTVDTVIENIGSLQGLLYPTYYMSVGAFHELLCYSDNNELIYRNLNRSKCYYGSPGELTDIPEIEENNFFIFPNPVTESIVLPELWTFVQIELYNLSGQKIYSEKLKPNQNKIAVGFLRNGTYFLKIQGENGVIYKYKIIKNN
jgi:hypothetical protein